MNERYGASNIRTSIVHFMTGKVFSSLAGLIYVVLVVKALSVEDFAAYSVLLPLDDLLTALSGLGLTHAVLRYVPELYAKQYQIALRRFVIGTILLRTLVLIIVVALVYTLSGSIAGFIGLSGAEQAFEVFLLLAVLRSSSNFVSHVLESALHQASTQAGFSVAAAGRLVGMLFLMENWEAIKLVQVIWIEMAAEAAGLAVMLIGLARMLILKAAEAPPDDGMWTRTHFRRVLRFALSGYVQHLTIMPYGMPNRFIGGHFLAPASMATYGFCLTFIDYVRRLLPAQLLIGVIRPVIVARYAQSRDFLSAVHTSNLAIKLNAMLVGIFIAYLPVAGEETISILTDGKYGHGTMFLLLILSVYLLMDTQRQQLELLTQTVEQYHLLIPVNLLLSASVLPAIFALPFIGAVALPLSNLCGLMLSNYWIASKLRRRGFLFVFAQAELLRIASIVMLAMSAGLFVRYLTGAWWMGGAAILPAYFIAMYRWFKPDILELYRLARARNAPAPTQPFPIQAEGCPPHIVFGILSSRDSSLAIAQIADCVRPHRVIVHHDFSKYPQFPILRDNISVLAAPTVTAWGDWSLVDATTRLMAEALKDPRCTHFQLLSESCLPFRPIAAFENFIKQNRPDAMIDLLPMDSAESAALASHGWRYLPRSAFMRRVARRASVWWHGNMPGHRQESSVNLTLPGQYANWPDRILQAIGRSVMKGFHSVMLGAFPLEGIKCCWIGGQWFGVSRAMAEHILAKLSASPQLVRHFSRCHIPDEAFFHTLIAHSGAARIYPSNHALFWDGCGTGPDLLEQKDIERLQTSGKFFARKLPLDPENSVRQPFLQGHSWCKLDHSMATERSL